MKTMVVLLLGLAAFASVVALLIRNHLNRYLAGPAARDYRQGDYLPKIFVVLTQTTWGSMRLFGFGFAGFLTEHRGPRRGSLQIRSIAFAMQTFVVLTMVSSCELRDESEATSRDGHVARETLAAYVPTVVDSSGSQPSSPEVVIAPAEPNPPATGTDTGSFATPLELADLSARLDVPVQGITRAQLRDTYAEPRSSRVHEALDIPAPRGTPVLSATDGRLLKLFNSKPGGLMVYATDTSERFILLYGHLDSYGEGLSDGMRLQRGQVIGYVGTTGNAPIGTPHLHFAILRGNPKASWSKGTPVNPYPLLVQ
jgi:hypothetical protein